MSEIPHVIGEGSYGCVHKPNLKCKSKKYKQNKQNISKKISKFMLKRDAEDELKEYKTIQHIDKNKKYYLGNPTLCTPEKNKIYLNAISDCELYEKYKSKKKNFALLIMEDGGENLSEFSKSHVKEFNNSFNNKFWTEALRLFKGIYEFEKHGISHHDLKPQNIVYNKSKNRLNFIDFGFMCKIKDTIELCKNNKHYIAEYPFWSYPFEFAYLNKDDFMKVAKMTISEKTNYFDDLIYKLKHDKDSKIYIACSLYFDYITRNHSENDKTQIISKYMEDFKNMILYEIIEDNYDEFVRKSISTIDVFGLGMSMQYMLCYCKNNSDLNLFNELEECFYNMMTPSLVNRYTISQALDKFQTILKENKLLGTSKMNIKQKNILNKNYIELNRDKKNKLLNMQDKLKELIYKRQKTLKHSNK